MAETERPHRSSSINSSSSKSELFICFPSRLSSSSSMRLSSKSIISPGRSASLSTSLSRRLHSSGSMKSTGGGVLASPMFGTKSRKRSGSGFDNNPEPSSPKVTCIGQVRVKTRKHVKKKMRARSRRIEGETSFRRSVDQNDSGSGWVHLPVTICESLKSLGSELNCFSPCRSSCSDGDQRRDRQRNPQVNGGCDGGSSCGAVFARWFVAVEETGGNRREIELVVGGEEEDDRRWSHRRHVFDGMDFGEIEVKTWEVKEEETSGVSICVPPKNALLLMRCRSDPVKATSLATRVRESALSQNNDVEEEEHSNEDDDGSKFEIEMEDKKRIELCEKWIFGESFVARESSEAVASLNSQREKDETEGRRGKSAEEEGNVLEDHYDEEIEAKFIRKIEDELRNILEEENTGEAGDSAEVEAASVGSGGGEEKEENLTEILKQERSGPGDPNNRVDPERDTRPMPEEGEIQQKESEKETPSRQVLPDCLLLMMCEPKLSMEVSKETWVCKTDFVRCLPERPPPANKTEGGDPPKKRTGSSESNASSRRRSTDKRPPAANMVLLQPPRSSCSYPAAPLPLVAEQKVGSGSKGYEPLVLKRCKSEPRKSSAKLAAPDTCFWKNRKLGGPYVPATLGVGAAGVGF